MISIKSASEIDKMRKAGEIVGLTHKLLEEKVCDGITALEIDRIAEEFIRSKGAIPSFKNYGGFPASVCISINDVVIHGIPDNRVIKNGDIVSLDIGALIGGYHGDSANTIAVGEVSKVALDLIKTTKESFYKGIANAVIGNRISDISHAVQEHCENNGFSVVRDYVGHGVGRNLHEDPEVPNFGKPGRGPRLYQGMTIAVEPMVNEGKKEVRRLNDGWTVVTADGKLSAHYEHTIAITKNEPILLTKVD